LLNERDAGGMGFDRVAGEDAGDFASLGWDLLGPAFLRPVLLHAFVLGQGHVEDKVVVRHARNLKQLVVQGIAGNRAFGSQGFADESRRVDDLDGLLRGQAGSDELASAAEAEHQVLLDESQRDMQIGGHETLVDVDRRAAAGCAQLAMGREILGVVADDAIFSRDLRPDDDFDFIFGGAAMQPGGDEDGDALDGNACPVKAFEQGRQGDPVGSGAGDIAEADGCGLLSRGKLAEPRRADGVIERCIKRGLLIVEGARGVAHDDLGSEVIGN